MGGRLRFRARSVDRGARFPRDVHPISDSMTTPAAADAQPADLEDMDMVFEETPGGMETGTDKNGDSKGKDNDEDELASSPPKRTRRGGGRGGVGSQKAKVGGKSAKGGGRGGGRRGAGSAVTYRPQPSTNSVMTCLLGLAEGLFCDVHCRESGSPLLKKYKLPKHIDSWLFPSWESISGFRTSWISEKIVVELA